MRANIQHLMSLALLIYLYFILYLFIICILESRTAKLMTLVLYLFQSIDIKIKYLTSGCARFNMPSDLLSRF